MGPPPTTADGAFKLEYRDRSSIRVRGRVTGREYRFSEEEPVQVVDRRDAGALLRTPYFRRV